MLTPAPNDNLPTDSMKWGRWVTATITDNERRISNLETQVSNLNASLQSAMSSLNVALRKLS